MAEYMSYIWLVLAVVLGIVEVCTAQFVSIWFVIGSVITSLCAATFLSDSMILQIVIFLFSSAVSLLLTRPFVRRIKKVNKTTTNADRFIGREGVVIIDINWQTSTGQVEVDGSRWSARSVDNTTIKSGTTVLVEDIQGVKLVVKPINTTEKE